MHLLFHFAYLDPGTGSLIIQSIVGAIAGVLVFGRRYITSAKHKLQQKFGKKSGAADQASAKPADDTSNKKDDTNT